MPLQFARPHLYIVTALHRMSPSQPRSLLIVTSFLLSLSVCVCVCSEWVVNQHRDSLASYVGHPNLMEYFAIADNESKARVKFNFLQVRSTTTSNPHTIMCILLCFDLQKMLQPCGLPQEKVEQD